VTCVKTGTVTQFPCGLWLSEAEGDAALSRDLVPADPSASAAPAIVSYRILVHTSDVRGGGTTAKVHVQVCFYPLGAIRDAGCRMEAVPGYTMTGTGRRTAE
jgi:hypothetical protein